MFTFTLTNASKAERSDTLVFEKDLVTTVMCNQQIQSQSQCFILLNSMLTMMMLAKLN